MRYRLQPQHGVNITAFIPSGFEQPARFWPVGFFKVAAISHPHMHMFV